MYSPAKQEKHSLRPSIAVCVILFCITEKLAATSVVNWSNHSTWTILLFSVSEYIWSNATSSQMGWVREYCVFLSSFRFSRLSSRHNVHCALHNYNGNASHIWFVFRIFYVWVFRECWTTMSEKTTTTMNARDWVTQTDWCQDYNARGFLSFLFRQNETHHHHHLYYDFYFCVFVRSSCCRSTDDAFDSFMYAMCNALNA